MAQWNSNDFDDYVKETASRLLATIRRILRNDADAEDALQETYLAAWRAQDRFDGNDGQNRTLGSKKKRLPEAAHPPVPIGKRMDKLKLIENIRSGIKYWSSHQ